MNNYLHQHFVTKLLIIGLLNINQSINLLKAKGPYGHLHRSAIQYELYIK